MENRAQRLSQTNREKDFFYSCHCTGEVEASHVQSPLPWLQEGLSLSLDLALTHPEHPFPHGEGVTVQAERQVPPSPAFPRVMTQTLLFLSRSTSWQPRPCSQNLWHCGPKCSVAPGRLHLEVSPRGSKVHGDGTDLSSRHFPFPSPQSCLCGIFIATELGKPHSGACAVQDTSLFSLPCSAP